MNLCSGLEEQKYRCFIFSDDVSQIEALFSSDKKHNINCKVIDTKTEIRFLKQVLQKDYNVDISRIDLLDDNHVFILCRNFNKIDNIPTSKLPEEKDVIENLKNDLLIIATITLTRLSIELPKMQNKKNAKYRNKTKLCNMLKQVVSKDFANIL